MTFPAVLFIKLHSTAMRNLLYKSTARNNDFRGMILVISLFLLIVSSMTSRDILASIASGRWFKVVLKQRFVFYQR